MCISPNSLEEWDKNVHYSVIIPTKRNPSGTEDNAFILTLESAGNIVPSLAFPPNAGSYYPLIMSIQKLKFLFYSPQSRLRAPKWFKPQNPLKENEKPD